MRNLNYVASNRVDIRSRVLLSM